MGTQISLGRGTHGPPKRGRALTQSCIEKAGIRLRPPTSKTLCLVVTTVQLRQIGLHAKNTKNGGSHVGNPKTGKETSSKAQTRGFRRRRLAWRRDVRTRRRRTNYRGLHRTHAEKGGGLDRELSYLLPFSPPRARGPRGDDREDNYPP